MRKRLPGIAVIVACVVTSAQPLATPQAPATPMRVEWMFGPEAEAVSSVPQTRWLDGVSFFYYDVRRPEAQRVIEVVDAGTGEHRTAVDSAKALANLKALAGEKEMPAALPWPDEVGGSGKRALFRLAGGFYVLDLPSGQFRGIPRQRTEIRGARLSPDGAHVAFVRDNDLWMWEFEGGRERRLTTDGSSSVLNGVFSWVYWEEIFNHEDAAFWWAPDSRSLAFLRTDESRVFLHSFVGFEPFLATVTTQRYPQAGQANPTATLGVVSLQTGRVAWMSTRPPAYEYIVRVTWMPSARVVGVQTLNRAQNELSLLRVDGVTGAAAPMLTEKDSAWMHFYDPLFLENGREFLWVSDRTGYAHIYRYRIDGRLLNAVTEGEWSVWPWGAYSGGHSGLAAVDEKNGWVFFTAKAASPFEHQLYRARLEGGLAERLSKEDGDHAVTFSRDGSRYLDVYSRASRPPALSLHMSGGAEVRELAPSRQDLVATFRMQYPEFFTIRAADGTALPAQISRPRGFNPGRRYPVILYVYGGPSAPSVADGWNHNGWSQSVYFDQTLLDQGYVVVSADNRSSAGIGKRFERTVQGQMWGDVELGDLESVIAWLKAQLWVDADRLGVWGWSGGGTATLMAMTRTNVFKAGVAIAAVTDWHYYDTKYTELVMGTPEANPAGYEKTSFVKRAKDLHGRLLLVQGSGDDNVYFQNSLAFMNALIEAGLPFDCMVYPMRKHTIPDAPARIHLFRTMLEFWKRAL